MRAKKPLDRRKERAAFTGRKKFVRTTASTKRTDQRTTSASSAVSGRGGQRPRPAGARARLLRVRVAVRGIEAGGEQAEEVVHDVGPVHEHLLDAGAA